MYNYYEEEQKDIRDYINIEINRTDWTDNREGLEEELNNALWTEDSVTGNASGSYTFCTATARDYVLNNIDILKDMYDEFGTSASEVGEAFLDEEWETMDVSIRCYLLPQCIAEVLDELEEEGFFEEESEDKEA